MKTSIFVIPKDPKNPNCFLPCKLKTWKEIKNNQLFIIRQQHTFATTLVNFLHLMRS